MRHLTRYHSVRWTSRFGIRASAAPDDGQEVVGQALLVTAVSVGALTASQLSRIAVDACQTLIAALG